MKAQRSFTSDSLRSATPRRKSTTNNGYLLIKSWGCGFYSDVFATLGALLLAEITERIPVIHWEGSSLFGGFENFYEPINSSGINNIPDGDFFPPKWSKENLTEEVSKWAGPHSRMQPESYLGQDEEVAVCDFFVGVVDLIPHIPPTHVMYQKDPGEIYRWLTAKYLRPRQEIVARANIFRQENLQGPYAAVHIRGSDKFTEVPNINDVNMSGMKVLKTVPQEVKIFLLTDDTRWLDITRQHFGARVIATDCKRTCNNTGSHHLYASGVELGQEVMIDTLLASQAQFFLGNGTSNVSLMVLHMRNWPAGRWMLNCPPLWSSGRTLQK